MVAGTGRKPSAVVRKGHRIDGTLMPAQCEAFVTGDAPQPQRLVHRSTRQPLAVRREMHARHYVSVALKLPEWFSGSQVPQNDGPIYVRRGQNSAISRERSFPRTCGVTLEREQFLIRVS